MPTIKKKAYARKKNASKKQSEQEILTAAHSVSDFISRNRKVMTTVFCVLAAVFILWAAYSIKLSMDEKNAAPLLAAGYEVYSPATGSKPDYAKALELFREVQKKYPSTMSGSIAAYYVGNSFAAMGRYEEALKQYQSVVDGRRGDKFLRGLVYARIGYAYSQMGKQAEAINAFEQADSMSEPGIATIELARLYEASGKSAESQQKYKVIADKLPGTQWATEAMGKVEKIEPAPAAGESK